jgi:hypothetical protein
MNLCDISFERRGGTNLVLECHFFVEAEILRIRQPLAYTKKTLLILYTNTMGQWKRCPCWLTSAICRRSFQKWYGSTLGRSLVAFAPANASSLAQKPKGQSLDQWFRYLQVDNG